MILQESGRKADGGVFDVHSFCEPVYLHSEDGLDKAIARDLVDRNDKAVHTK